MIIRLPAAALLLAGLLACAGALSAPSRMEQATAQPAPASALAPPRPAVSDATQPPAAAATKPQPMAMPAAPNEVILDDPASRQRYLAAMQGYYEYMANGYRYRSRVFEWQLLSSRLIFVVVLGLVGAGMYFAAVQFRLAMRAAARKLDATQPAVPDPGVSLATQLEVSAKGVVINSSVMGLIILTLSLAFFYLYLVYVYPIEDVF
jgi:hypothetical protein